MRNMSRQGNGDGSTGRPRGRLVAAASALTPARCCSASCPAPYTDQQARRFAQAALILAELLEREHINTRHAAATLGLPEPELADALADAKASRDTSPTDA